jgi:DNA replicative helicase MCM subunit Mcm2 (Cdc46/Mcm family)
MHRCFVHGSFDLIFIVRDVRDETRDQKIAEHVIQVGGCVKP